MEEEKDQEEDMDYSNVEDFLDALSEEEFIKNSVKIIISNDKFIANCLMLYQINCSNVDLIVKDIVKNSLFLILHEAKSFKRK